MTATLLEPRVELLSEEYVLAQAWKKTASHIRYHNWYSDILELDRAAVDLPRFLTNLAAHLKAPDSWRNDPLRIVPAPKSQRWRVRKATGWEPIDRAETAVKLRPLAHVSLKDQIIATALMLCLADRVEAIQGNPRHPPADFKTRSEVVSYGNRLFCHTSEGPLRHPWGSTKLYRSYYEDYRTFLSRPEQVAQATTNTGGSLTVIVHSDLDKFYDRVQPTLLAQKLAGIARPDDDPGFFALAGRVLPGGNGTRKTRGKSQRTRSTLISTPSNWSLCLKAWSRPVSSRMLYCLTSIKLYDHGCVAKSRPAFFCRMRADMSMTSASC